MPGKGQMGAGKGPMGAGKGVGRQRGSESRGEPVGQGRPESPGRSASSPGHLKKGAEAHDASSYARGRSKARGSEAEPEVEEETGLPAQPLDLAG